MVCLNSIWVFKFYLAIDMLRLLVTMVKYSTVVDTTVVDTTEYRITFQKGVQYGGPHTLVRLITTVIMAGKNNDG